MSDDASNHPWWRRHVVVEHVVPGVLAFVLGAILFLFGLGFRGLGPDGLTFVERARKLTQTLADGIGSASLASTRPLSELGLAWLWGLAPDAAFHWSGWLSGLLAAAALPAVWSMGRSLSGRTTGAAATLLCAGLPVVAGAATTVGHGAAMFFVWCWFLRLGTLERYPWWAGVALWIVTGTSLLVWPPIAAWLPFWLYLHLTHRTESAPEGFEVLSPGHIDRPAVPFVVLLSVPAALGVATALHPGFHGDVVGAWKTFATHNLGASTGAFLYGGELYEQARPLPWAGLRLAWMATPPVVACLALLGWGRRFYVGWAEATNTRSGEWNLVARTLVWGLPLACLIPWLTRSRTFAGVDFLLAVAPAAAVLGGDVAARVLDVLEARLLEVLDETPARAVTAVVGTLLFAAPLIETVRVHPFEGSYYNPASGGLAGAVSEGFPASRDGVVPRSAMAEIVRRTPEGGLYVSGDTSIVDLYARQGATPSVEQLPSGHEAGAILRRLEVSSTKSGAASKEGEPVDAFVRADAPELDVWRVDGVPLWILERYPSASE